MLLLCFHGQQIEIESNLTQFQIRGQGVDEEPIGILQIDKYTGEVTVHGPVDYERFQSLQVCHYLPQD